MAEEIPEPRIYSHALADDLAADARRKVGVLANPDPLKRKWSLHDYERAQESVWRKIQKVCNVSNNDLTLSRSRTAEVTDGTAIALNTAQWFKTRNTAIRESGLLPDAAADIDAIAASAIHRYHQAFHMRYLLRFHTTDNDLTPEYRPLFTKARQRDHLMDVYTSHLSNCIELELQAVGLDAKSAHIVHGRIIYDACHILNTERCNFVKPHCGPITQDDGSILDDATIDERISHVRNYWREAGEKLQTNLRIHQGRNL